jgi:hypothetical protein
MPRTAFRTFVLGVACLSLVACVTRREFVVAPETRGVVIDSETGAPVDGAVVRFAGVEAITPAVTGPDGRFALPGRTQARTIVAMPMGGVFRDAARVKASTPGRAEAFATAAFIQGGKPAQAFSPVTVLMFPHDAAPTELHALTGDCLHGALQDHARHLAAFVAGIDPAGPPDWLDAETAAALEEHLRLSLPSSGFMACAQMNEAYALFRRQMEPLEAIQRAAYLESLPPHLSQAAQP